MTVKRNKHKVSFWLCKKQCNSTFFVAFTINCVSMEKLSSTIITHPFFFFGKQWVCWLLLLLDQTGPLSLSLLLHLPHPSFSLLFSHKSTYVASPFQHSQSHIQTTSQKKGTSLSYCWHGAKPIVTVVSCSLAFEVSLTIVLLFLSGLLGLPCKRTLACEDSVQSISLNNI